jgi:Ca2+-binding EF-hand superfamily protein
MWLLLVWTYISLTIPTPLPQASKDPMVVEKIMSDLDENKDGEVDFQEFVILVAALTVACNEFFVESLNE